jgi:hypothetical protein
MLDAWENKEAREEMRLACLQLTIAQSNGLKKRNGGALSVEDFLPDYVKRKRKKPNPEKSELQIKAALIALAARSKKQHGQ